MSEGSSTSSAHPHKTMVRRTTASSRAVSQHHVGQLFPVADWPTAWLISNYTKMPPVRFNFFSLEELSRSEISAAEERAFAREGQGQYERREWSAFCPHIPSDPRCALPSIQPGQRGPNPPLALPDNRQPPASETSPTGEKKFDRPQRPAAP